VVEGLSRIAKTRTEKQVSCVLAWPGAEWTADSGQSGGE